MAGGAVGGAERLVVMRLLQARILYIVAVEAECRSALRKVIVEFGFANLSDLVRGVAGIAAEIERGMAAAFFRDVQSLFVAIETKILALIARFGLE